MADRFWVGGSGDWDDTAHWSTSSGGSGGASEPTSADNVFFDAISGGGTIELVSGPTCANLTTTGFTGSFNASTLGNIAVNGDVVLGSGTSFATPTTGISFEGSTGQLTSNGVTIGVLDCTNGCDVTLVDAVTVSSTLRVRQGATFDAVTHDVTCSTLIMPALNTSTISFGSGTWTINNQINFAAAGGTVNADTATIILVGSAIQARPEYLLPSVNKPSGTANFTGTGVNLLDLDFTGNSGVLNAGSELTVRGNLTFGSGMTVSADNDAIKMGGSSGTQTITSNGVTIDRPLIIDAAGATVQLADALTLGSTRALTLTNGTFDANGFNVTAGSFASSNSNSRTVSMGSGTWTLLGTGIVWDVQTPTNLTLNGETSSLVIGNNSGDAKTFHGGGRTYYDFTWGGDGGGGGLLITGNNSFHDFTVQPRTDSGTRTLTVTADSTQTFSGAVSLTGNASNPIALQSSSSSQFFWSKSSGTVTGAYLIISDSNVSGGATWDAGEGSVDNDGNTGWTFPELVIDPPPVQLVFDLPSPFIDTGINIRGPPLGLEIQTLVPIIGERQEDAPGFGAIAEGAISEAEGEEESQAIVVSPPPLEIESRIFPPVILSGANVSPNAHDVLLGLDAPAIASGVFVSPPFVEIEVAFPAPAISIGLNIRPPPVEFSVETPPPDVLSGAVVLPPQLEFILGLPIPQVGSSTEIQPPTAEIATDFPIPAVSGGDAISPPPLEFRLDLFAPSISSGAAIAPDSVDIDFDIPAPVVSSIVLRRQVSAIYY